MTVSSKSSGDSLTAADVNSFNTTVSGNVQSGCVVQPQAAPDMTVKTNAGVIRYQEARVAVSASSSITVTAANGSNPRRDIVYVNASGTVAYTAGTAAASPVAPSVPTGNILLAEILVGTGVTTITTDDIFDRRNVIGYRSIFHEGRTGATTPTELDTITIPANKYSEYFEVIYQTDFADNTATARATSLTFQKNGGSEIAVIGRSFNNPSADAVGSVPLTWTWKVTAVSDSDIWDPTTTCVIRFKSNMNNWASGVFIHSGR